MKLRQLHETEDQYEQLEQYFTTNQLGDCTDYTNLLYNTILHKILNNQYDDHNQPTTKNASAAPNATPTTESQSP